MNAVASYVVITLLNIAVLFLVRRHLKKKYQGNKIGFEEKNQEDSTRRNTLIFFLEGLLPAAEIKSLKEVGGNKEYTKKLSGILTITALGPECDHIVGRPVWTKTNIHVRFKPSE